MSQERISFKHRHWGIPLRVTFNEPAQEDKNYKTVAVLNDPNDFTVYHAAVMQAASFVAKFF